MARQFWHVTLAFALGILVWGGCFTESPSKSRDLYQREAQLRLQSHLARADKLKNWIQSNSRSTSSQRQVVLQELGESAMKVRLKWEALSLANQKEWPAARQDWEITLEKFDDELKHYENQELLVP